MEIAARDYVRARTCALQEELMSNLVAYVWHLFQDPTTSQQQLTDLQQSGFTTVIPWTLHVQANGDLVYNELVAQNTIVSGGSFQSQNFPSLPGLLAALKTGATSVTNVIFCIGSAVAEIDDFKNIQSLLETEQGKNQLAANIAALVDAIPAIDGFDFDNESFPLSQYTGTMATLAEMIQQTNRKITFCPYMEEPAWAASLEQIYTSLGSQPVAWWNLQCYDGGSGNTPGEWVAAFPSSGTGVSDPAAFILPGVAATTPEDVQSTLTQLVANDPGIPGAFLWEASAVWASGQSLAPYAAAMKAALGPTV